METLQVHESERAKYKPVLIFHTALPLSFLLLPLAFCSWLLMAHSSSSPAHNTWSSQEYLSGRLSYYFSSAQRNELFNCILNFFVELTTSVYLIFQIIYKTFFLWDEWCPKRVILSTNTAEIQQQRKLSFALHYFPVVEEDVLLK